MVMLLFFRLLSLLCSLMVMGLSLGNSEARADELIWSCQHPNRDIYAGLDIKYDEYRGHTGRLYFEFASAQLLCAQNQDKFQCLGFWGPEERMERVEIYSLVLKNNQKAAVFMAPQDYGKKEISLICQKRGSK